MRSQPVRAWQRSGRQKFAQVLAAIVVVIFCRRRSPVIVSFVVVGGHSRLSAVQATLSAAVRAKIEKRIRSYGAQHLPPGMQPGFDRVTPTQKHE